MTDRDYLINSIHENFIQFKDKRIVIYGISNQTKIVLDNCTGFNILGLMDVYLTEGSLYGANILSYEEVLSLKTEIIVIVARASSTKIIYKRISKFCVENKIGLYDVNGSNLIEKLGALTENSEYFDVNEEQLKKAIFDHDVISFDIFDTLIMRKVLYATDVFEMVAQKINRALSVEFEFVKARILAEQQLLVGNYPTYDMIYENLQKNTGISEKNKIYLKDLEFSIEQSVLVPRMKMIEILQYAISLDKAVYLVSDMYLTKDKMEKILHANGIYEYDDLLISCEYGTTKTQQLFEVLKEKIGEKECLHIGDNYDADVLSAKLNGIDSFEIFSSRQMLEISSYKEILNDTDSLAKRCIIGLFIEKAFNNPFALYHTDGRLKISDSYDLGYLFIAPLIAGFISWLIMKIKEKEYNKILFLARDGYLIQKLYEKALEFTKEKDYPEGVYFLTSRIVCIAATLYDVNDIRRAFALGFDGTPELLMKNRFLLNDKDILPYQSDLQEPEDYVLLHKDIILEKSKNIRESYEKYALNMGITKDDKMAVFDLAASGTCQMCLQDIFSQMLYGYYFINIKDEDVRKKKLQVESLFKIDTWFHKEAFICESYILLESIITSFKPSLKEFSNNGEPIYVDENRNDVQLKNVSILQQAIEDYFQNYIELKGTEETYIRQTDKLLSFIQNKYTIIENISIMQDKLQDEFFNRSYCFSDILD